MDIKILYLYHDLMNLYGDNGNIRCMARRLQDQGFEVVVDRLSIGDEVNLSGYDFYYIGSGTEKNQKAALTDLLNYADDLRDQIENDKVMLFTGNAFEMLGKGIVDASGILHPALDILDFETEENSEKRDSCDVIYECGLLDKAVIGYVNKASCITGVKTPLFMVQRGVGNSKEDLYEGVVYHNVFGTHVTGPVLVKNPHFADLLVKRICQRFEGAVYQDIAYENEQRAYSTTLTALSLQHE